MSYSWWPKAQSDKQGLVGTNSHWVFTTRTTGMWSSLIQMHELHLVLKILLRSREEGWAHRGEVGKRESHPRARSGSSLCAHLRRSSLPSLLLPRRLLGEKLNEDIFYLIKPSTPPRARNARCGAFKNWELLLTPKPMERCSKRKVTDHGCGRRERREKRKTGEHSGEEISERKFTANKIYASDIPLGYSSLIQSGVL